MIESERNLTYCKYGCGNNFHIECMKVFGESRKQSKEAIICPLCRKDWGETALTELKKEADISNRNPLVHTGTTCKQCQIKPIRCNRYRCLQCKHVDLCERCFKSNAHAKHSFVMRKAHKGTWFPALRALRDSLLTPSTITELENRELSHADYDLLLELDAAEKYPLQDYLMTNLSGEKLPPARAKEWSPPTPQSSTCCTLCAQSLKMSMEIRILPCEVAHIPRKLPTATFTCSENSKPELGPNGLMNVVSLMKKPDGTIQSLPPVVKPPRSLSSSSKKMRPISKPHVSNQEEGLLSAIVTSKSTIENKPKVQTISNDNIESTSSHLPPLATKLSLSPTNTKLTNAQKYRTLNQLQKQQQKLQQKLVITERKKQQNQHLSLPNTLRIGPISPEANLVPIISKPSTDKNYWYVECKACRAACQPDSGEPKAIVSRLQLMRNHLAKCPYVENVPKEYLASIVARPAKYQRAKAGRVPVSGSPIEPDSAVSPTSWLRNLVRPHQPQAGFWGDARWYDLHLTKRLPLVPKMHEQMVLALPPLGENTKVADICAGSGLCAEKVIAAYPDTHIVLFDMSLERQQLAAKRLGHHNQFTYCTVNLNETAMLEKGPFDVITASLAIHVLVEKPEHYATGEQKELESIQDSHCRLFQMIFDSLLPNGHIIIGDHVGMASTFAQMKWLESVGFEDVDIAWRENDCFVIGARRPFNIGPLLHTV
ncbi:hypothetical protein THRCLA_06865 [Thraustotheca clavata]|uniref:ZZ-type domain-containing protein n=1 Tax=Thraustotheca clavata TaxID=74557 RepID=A0A1V9ZIG3_9STRA|nr:hypothetical protein THRCLA_06865 [Thraustotheca clavata]